MESEAWQQQHEGEEGIPLRMTSCFPRVCFHCAPTPAPLVFISNWRTSQSSSHWTTSRYRGFTPFTWKLCVSHKGEFRRNMLKESELRQLIVLNIFLVECVQVEWGSKGHYLNPVHNMASRWSNIHFKSAQTRCSLDFSKRLVTLPDSSNVKRSEVHSSLTLKHVFFSLKS